MNILQLVPPNQLEFHIPDDLGKTITATNLSMNSVAVLILPSHPQDIKLSHSFFILQAFQEKQVKIILNWRQQARQFSPAKLRVVYRELEQEGDLDHILPTMYEKNSATLSESFELTIKRSNQSYIFLSQEKSSKKEYIMQMVSHQQLKHSVLKEEEDLKNQILKYLQALPQLLSINPFGKRSFLIEINSSEDFCQMPVFSVNEKQFTYSLRKIIQCGNIVQHESLLSVNNYQKITISENHSKQNFKKIKNQQNGNENVNEKEKVVSKQNGTKYNSKKTFIKQSFAGKRVIDKVKQRRNKSEQKIIEHCSDEEDEAQLFKQQMQELQRISKRQKKEEIFTIDKKQSKNIGQKQDKLYKQKINKTSFQFTQKILAIHMEQHQQWTQINLIFKDCVRIVRVGQDFPMKIIKFQAMYQENTIMPCAVDRYKDQLIFGNQTILYWVNVKTEESQWKYVQRKYIYSLAVIDQLSLVAVGGKNFSKLSYFGKETTRSNVKLYSCSSMDKHDHLFTYDLPGIEGGIVVNLAYVIAPPHNFKLLLVHSLSPASANTFLFLRVKAFNKIQVFGIIELDDLGILNLIKIRHNKETGRVISMESLGQTSIDSFKKIKIKCQYDKVEVATEGLKFPLKKYSSIQIGGGQGKKEWMTLIDDNGTLYIYDFKDKETKVNELARSDIRNSFYVSNGRFLIHCTEGTLFVQQNVQKK